MEKLRDLRYSLEEIAYQLRDYSNAIEFNPGRLEAVQERLAEIQKARRKYGDTVDEILSYSQEIQREVTELSQRETQIEQLTEKEKRLGKEYLELAHRLSQERHQKAQLLS